MIKKKKNCIRYKCENHLLLHLHCPLFLIIISTNMYTLTPSLYQCNKPCSTEICGLLSHSHFDFTFNTITIPEMSPAQAGFCAWNMDMAQSCQVYKIDVQKNVHHFARAGKWSSWFTESYLLWHCHDGDGPVLLQSAGLEIFFKLLPQQTSTELHVYAIFCFLSLQLRRYFIYIQYFFLSLQPWR